jgi:hypothetical protein
MIRTLLVILIFTICSGVAQSQIAQKQDKNSTRSLSSTLCYDSGKFIDCIAIRFYETTRPDGSSLITVGIVTGTTASLFLADQSIRSIKAQPFAAE